MKQIFIGEDKIDIWVYAYHPNQDRKVEITDEEYKWLQEIEDQYCRAQEFLGKKFHERKAYDRNRRRV